MSDRERVEALDAGQRATLLRVLDWGVESRNMPYDTALQVLAIADAHDSSAMRDLLAEAKADAWDEGFRQGTSYEDIRNPYRETTTGGRDD